MDEKICLPYFMHTAKEKEIERKAKKVMGMLKRSVKFTPMRYDVMAIQAFM